MMDAYVCDMFTRKMFKEVSIKEYSFILGASGVPKFGTYDRECMNLTSNLETAAIIAGLIDFGL